MSTMADTVAAHVLSHADWDDEWLIVTCYCGAEATKQHDGTQYTCQEEELLHAEHVAAELAAAGYGNMADAWNEGYKHGRIQQADANLREPFDPVTLQRLASAAKQLRSNLNSQKVFMDNPYRGAGHE